MIGVNSILFILEWEAVQSSSFSGAHTHSKSFWVTDYTALFYWPYYWLFEARYCLIDERISSVQAPANLDLPFEMSIMT
jgi:hypothetical protein